MHDVILEFRKTKSKNAEDRRREESAQQNNLEKQNKNEKSPM